MVAVRAALGAQPEAIGPTERRKRQLQDTGIVGKRFQVEPVSGHGVAELGVRVVFVELVDLGRQAPSRHLETTPALPFPVS